MKRLFLLPPALLLLFTATPAFALSAQCKTILSLKPISPYVQQVIDRADAGLSEAENSPVTDIFGTLPDWADRIAQDWNALLYSHWQSHSDLTQATTCLRFDLAQIDCKMDDVRDTMNSQAPNRSLSGLLQMESLLAFLNDRYLQLQQGALDPSYSDPAWAEVQPFDPPQDVYCFTGVGEPCEQMPYSECVSGRNKSYKDEGSCIAAGGTQAQSSAGSSSSDSSSSTTDMCPYNSDYSPPLSNGYGCDLDVLKTISAFPPAAQEAAALKTISDQIDEERTAAQQFLSTQEEIDNLTGTQSQEPSAPPKRTHLKAYGCKWTGGLCAGTPQKRCAQNSDCGNNDTCQYPQNICKGNRNLTCFTDADCQTQATDLGPCIPNDGKTPAMTELRGPFSLLTNNIKLTLLFLERRVQEGLSRQFSDSLKNADEFPSSQASDASERAAQNFFEQDQRNQDRLVISGISQAQGALEAESFPYITDPQLEVAHALSPLRQAVGDLAKIATDKKTGLRSFVINFAYYLRRSCIYRPCNASLEEILKIAFSDACFPYTNGDFLKDNPANPRWKQCAQQAGISLP